MLKVKDVKFENVRHFKFMIKYVADGMFEFNPYKKLFKDSENSYEILFLMSLIPLRLKYLKDLPSPVFWKNPRPSSPKYCVPIMFEYAEETKSKILLECGNIDKQIKRRKPSKVEIDGFVYFVEHDLIGTIIDDKISQNLTEASSAVYCTILYVTQNQVR